MITRKFRIHCVAVMIGIFTAGPVCGQEPAARKDRVAPDYLFGEEAQSVRIYREVLPSVVTVFTSRDVLEKNEPMSEKTIGSGVLISPVCHVLTAAHVVEGADRIIVKTHDGNLRPAELLFSEPSADIALLRLITPETELAHARLGDSDRLAVGQVAYAIGSPFGLENSYSVGHISGFREFDRLYDGSIKAEYIQTDAAINSGNSGGPVFNSRGEVIGIASTILTQSGGSQGLGLVVAINTAKQLLALEDRTWMGIEGVFLSRAQISGLLNHDLEGGLLIEHVAKGSPAEAAGLRGGSILTRIFDRNFLLGGDLVVAFYGQDECRGDCLMDASEHLAGRDRVRVRFLREGGIMEAVIDLSNARRNFLKE